MKLNLGCGNAFMPVGAGWLNVDQPIRKGYAYCTPTVFRCDLNSYPWPWDNNSIDEIKMWHVLEHLQDINAVLYEVHRVLKPGGVFWGQVPYGNSDCSFFALDHLHHIFPEGFRDSRKRFGLDCIIAESDVQKDTVKKKIRNCIPRIIRRVAAELGICNCFDVVNFRLQKPLKD